MKKLSYLFVAVLAVIGIASCSKEQGNEQDEIQKWEYKTMFVVGDSFSDFYTRQISVPQAEMDTLGAQGWELVSVYTKTETVHPNFGDNRYVTGLQANTRTAAVYYVFKRPVRNNNQNDSQTTEDAYQVERILGDSVPADTVAP